MQGLPARVCDLLPVRQHVLRQLVTASDARCRVCRTLRFEDKPDYSYMRKLFRDLFIKEGYQVRAGRERRGCNGPLQRALRSDIALAPP